MNIQNKAIRIFFELDNPLTISDVMRVSTLVVLIMVWYK